MLSAVPQSAILFTFNVLYILIFIKKEDLYFKGPLFTISLKKLVIRSSRPFSSNLFVFAIHSEAVSNRPRIIVTPQLVKKQVIMLVA